MAKQYKVSYKVKGKQFEKIVSQPKALILAKLYGKQKGFRAMKAPALASKVETASYKIQQGDTLSGIAKKTSSNIEELKKLNPQIKDVNKIKEGQTVKIVGQGTAFGRGKEKARGEGFGPVTGPKGKPWYPETARAKPWKEKYTKLKKSMPKSEVAKAIRIQGDTRRILDREFKALNWQKKYLAKLLAKTPRTGKFSQTAITKKFREISKQIKMNREVSSQVPSYNTAWNANLIRLISKRLPLLERYESKYKKRFKD